MKTKTVNRITSKVQAYVDSILSGSVPSCETVRLACERWNNDWKRKDLYFDEAAVGKFYRFATNLKHYKGEKAGTYIKLEPWQLFIAANIFGWKRKDTKKRRYIYADVFVPRKNGKTTFAAIIALFCELFDDEPGAEVYAAAVDKEQARICFGTSQELIKGSVFAPAVQLFRGSIVSPSTASVYKPLSKETKNKDGLNPHAAVCDERHAWSTNEIYEVLKTGMGARSQPLIFSISTAGTDTSLPYFRDLETLEDVIRGIKEKDNHFILLFRPDATDNWEDPQTWAKVNPNLGVSLSLRYMQEEYEEAKLKGGTTLAAFQTKNLNMWVDAPEVWIPDDDVQACNSPLDESKLAGEDCYVGIDLSSKTDLAAVAFYFPKYKAAKFRFFIPEEKVKEKEDTVDYRLWASQGYITVMPGKILDEDWFISYILLDFDRYKIKCIAYDPWGMWNILQKFGRYRDQLLEYQQSIRYMSVPTKQLEAMIYRKDITLLGNPVIRWNFKNVVIYRDPNANIKLDKARSRNKIDGVVALVDAIGGYLNLTAENNKDQIYSTHTLRTISMDDN